MQKGPVFPDSGGTSRSALARGGALLTFAWEFGGGITEPLLASCAISSPNEWQEWQEKARQKYFKNVFARVDQGPEKLNMPKIFWNRTGPYYTIYRFEARIED